MKKKMVALFYFTVFKESLLSKKVTPHYSFSSVVSLLVFLSCLVFACFALASFFFSVLFPPHYRRSIALEQLCSRIISAVTLFFTF